MIMVNLYERLSRPDTKFIIEKRIHKYEVAWPPETGQPKVLRKRQRVENRHDFNTPPSVFLHPHPIFFQFKLINLHPLPHPILTIYFYSHPLLTFSLTMSAPTLLCFILFSFFFSLKHIFQCTSQWVSFLCHFILFRSS